MKVNAALVFMLKPAQATHETRVLDNFRRSKVYGRDSLHQHLSEYVLQTKVWLITDNNHKASPLVKRKTVHYR